MRGTLSRQFADAKGLDAGSITVPRLSFCIEIRSVSRSSWAHEMGQHHREAPGRDGRQDGRYR